MTRLAVLADIHGNLPALEAVAADVATRKVDAVIDLGDIVSGPLWPRETLALLRRLGWPGVRGNHDRRVAHAPFDDLSQTDRFAADEIGEEGRLFLATLPATTVPAPGMLATHACPGDDERYLLEDVEAGHLQPASAERVSGRLHGVDAALVLTGHSHKPSLRLLAGGVVVVNPGSVGCPAYRDDEPEHVSETGAPWARYAVLTLRVSLGGRPMLAGADMVALAYDHGSAVRRARALDRPDWAHALAHGAMGPR